MKLIEEMRTASTKEKLELFKLCFCALYALATIWFVIPLCRRHIRDGSFPLFYKCLIVFAIVMSIYQFLLLIFIACWFIGLK